MNTRNPTTKRIGGTGFWPMGKPRPWNFEALPDVVVVKDPLLIAGAAAEGMIASGWPGFGLMDGDFQLGLVDKDPLDVAVTVEQWYVSHKDAVCNTLLTRLDAYATEPYSKTGRVAIREAVAAYGMGHYQTVVRNLFPEYAACARSIFNGKGETPSQKKVIDGLKRFLEELPFDQIEPIELFSLPHFIDERFFASCHSAASGMLDDGVPNRHADSHGLADYGTFKAATILLCVTSHLFQQMDRHQQLVSDGRSP